MINIEKYIRLKRLKTLVYLSVRQYFNISEVIKIPTNGINNYRWLLTNVEKFNP